MQFYFIFFFAKGTQQLATPKVSSLLRFAEEQKTAIMDQWLYQDAQGISWGPISSSDMMAWYGAGHFTMDVKVQRYCDLIMLTIGKW